MSQPLLVRDVMRIGVPTCKPGDTVQSLAVRMLEENLTALVVLDEDADTRGWVGERHLAAAFKRLATAVPPGPDLTAADIMEEDVPECPVDIPLSAAVQLMADMSVDHLFFMHRAGGRAWPASYLHQRDVVRALAGPAYIRHQGTAAPRPTPMDLFRQRYGLAGREK